MTFHTRQRMLEALQVPEWAQHKVENATRRLSNAAHDPKSALHPGLRIACAMAFSTPAYAFANQGIAGANEEGSTDGKRIYIPLGHLGGEADDIPAAATNRMAELLCVKLGMALNARENKSSNQPLYYCAGFPSIGSINPADLCLGLENNNDHAVVLQLHLEYEAQTHHEELLETLKFFDTQTRRMSPGEKNILTSWLIEAGYYPLNPRAPLDDHLCGLNAYFQAKALDTGVAQVKQQKPRARL